MRKKFVLACAMDVIALKVCIFLMFTKTIKSFLKHTTKSIDCDKNKTLFEFKWMSYMSIKVSKNKNNSFILFYVHLIVL